MRLRRYILAGLSGVLMVLVFPGINLSYLAWIALVPLLVSVYDADWKQSLKLGLVAGIIYFGGTLHWFMALGPFSSWFWVTLGFLAIMLYLSTYIFIFTVFVNFVTRYWILDNRHRKQLSSIQHLAYSFLVPIVWTGMEILRGRMATGFPWVCLGHTQWDNLPIIQISSITGMYGVTFLIAMINGAIASFFINIRKWRSWLKAVTIPFALLIATLVYGWIAMSALPQGEKIKVALVPGNIKQMDKLRSWGSADWILDKYIRTTERAAAEKPDIIVWPETSVPRYMFLSDSTQMELKSIVQGWNAYFLMGTPHKELYPERKTYNSAFLLSPEGEIIDNYYKIHLVPVGEFFPMKRYLPKSWQKLVTGVSDWDMGDRYTIFSAPPAKFGLVICFESIFPELFRKSVGKGVNLMGIITNDAWFDGTYAAEQHYSMAHFRAVENRVTVFRCANYGISCIIDPWGRAKHKIKPESNESYLVGDVCLRQGGTFYTRHGDYLPWACLVTTIFLIFQTWWYRRLLLW